LSRAASVDASVSRTGLILNSSFMPGSPQDA
jgi:hypothetical protein